MSTTSHPQDQGVVNWTAALEATGGDESLLAEVVVLFLKEASTLLVTLQRSIDEKDAVLLRRSAHTLKGSLRIFESARAIDLAAQMEQIGKDEQFHLAPALLKQLQPEMGMVIAELKRHKS